MTNTLLGLTVRGEGARATPRSRNVRLRDLSRPSRLPPRMVASNRDSHVPWDIHHNVIVSGSRVQAKVVTFLHMESLQPKLIS